jgi:hypothetical protein
MSSCLSREAGPLRAAVVAQISSNPAAQNDRVTSSVPEPLSPNPRTPVGRCLSLPSRWGGEVATCG